MQQYIGGVRIDVVLALLVILGKLPGLQVLQEGRQRVVGLRPGRPILRHAEARGVVDQLVQSDLVDVAAALQLGDVLCNRVIERKLALDCRHRQQRGVEGLAERCQIEQRVRRDRLAARGGAKIEEQRTPLDTDHDRSAARSFVFWEYLVELVLDRFAHLAIGHGPRRDGHDGRK